MQAMMHTCCEAYAAALSAMISYSDLPTSAQYHLPAVNASVAKQQLHSADSYSSKLMFAICFVAGTVVYCCSIIVHYNYNVLALYTDQLTIASKHDC